MYEARQNKEKVSRRIDAVSGGTKQRIKTTKKMYNNVTNNLVQRYALGCNYRRSDDKSIYLISKHCIYSRIGKMQEANRILNSRNSKIELVSKGTCIENYSNQSYDIVTAKHKSREGKGREVMGNNRPYAIYNKIYRTHAESDPMQMSIEIIRQVFSPSLKLTIDEGMAILDESRTLSRILGINRYANPTVGEGYTILSDSNAIPGYEDNTWNFHWAGIVMESDDKKDKVSLENYAVYDSELDKNIDNNEWRFDMYGQKWGQSFHDKHKASNLHGTNPMTMKVF